MKNKDRVLKMKWWRPSIWASGRAGGENQWKFGQNLFHINNHFQLNVGGGGVILSSPHHILYIIIFRQASTFSIQVLIGRVQA